MQLNRAQILNSKSAHDRGPVIYWMSRDQRAQDNWALIFASDLAERHGVDLKVVFNLRPKFKSATKAHFWFMLEGLRQTEKALRKMGISFHVIVETTPQAASKLIIRKFNPASIVVDTSPLREEKIWRQQLADISPTAVYQVDAHNIIPIWIASDKQEYSARTIRSKIHKKLDFYLEQYPLLKKQKNKLADPAVKWPQIYQQLKIEKYKPNKRFADAGLQAAEKILNKFIEEKLSNYQQTRNHPPQDGLSNLSAYLHFGQISAQTVAMQVIGSGKPQSAIDTFIEELIIRRELAENYCWYNPNYDNPKGFPDWAKITLEKHQSDPRQYHYTLKQLETSKTHDPLWNASQNQMVQTGKMHGYLRMYWAKKILEWSQTAQEAQKIAIYLNDKFELDGRDPNGYTGIAWAIGGVHDRPWPERAIFGKVRSMTFASTSRKIDAKSFIEQYS